MEHYQLIIAYDGTEYRGFQRQADSATIQGELETALRKIGWQGETIYAAGRTDTGVHASGQVISFSHDWQHSEMDLLAALNHFLPDDIAVQSVTLAGDEFHPRYDALSREYQYAITFSPVPLPQKERFMWRIDEEWNWDAVNEIAMLLVGEHDFSQFGKPFKPENCTHRKVLVSKWTQVNPTDRVYTIEANAFLYHMVRRIVFVLCKIGEGRTCREEVQKALAGEKNTIPPGIAPACGLTLTKVRYNDNIKD